jgi:short-subunit dehydrogenase
MQPQVVLITGASGGIGAELAKVAAAHGHDLVLVARDLGPLQTLAGALTKRHNNTVRVVSKDLSGPQAAQQLFDELQASGIVVDLLINNAGFGLYGQFWHSDTARTLDMLHVNVVTLTHLCRLFLPQMIERGRGRVLNVASIAAFQPGPMMAVYYASKAYVLSFSEALANELKGSGVTMTALCPGLTRTRFAQRAGLDLSRLFRWVPVSDPQRVAIVGYRAMMRGKTTAIPGVMSRLVAFSTRFAPRGLAAAVVRAMQERVAR